MKNKNDQSYTFIFKKQGKDDDLILKKLANKK